MREIAHVHLGGGGCTIGCVIGLVSVIMLVLSIIIVVRVILSLPFIIRVSLNSLVVPYLLYYFYLGSFG